MPGLETHGLETHGLETHGLGMPGVDMHGEDMHGVVLRVYVACNGRARDLRSSRRGARQEAGCY